MHHYLYLTIDLFSILFPLLFSFYPKAPFGAQWKSWLPAIILPAILFIAWDEWFAGKGVWGFNPQYVSGIYFFHLPLEEVLFFVCVPYACLFTYTAVNYFRKTEPLPNNGKRVTWVLIVALMVTGIRFYDLWYPAVAFVALSVYLLTLWIFGKPTYLGRFYFAFLFILVPFFLVNGILTGTGLPDPVVRYNDEENLKIRLGTIPVEDTFYGMLLILMNVSIFEFLQAKTKVI